MTASSERVLVVGTTPDYVEILRSRAPGWVTFVTHPGLRAHAREPRPLSDEEVLVDPNDTREALRLVEKHAHRHAIRWQGVACFDCESLAATSRIAASLCLRFPSARSVARCRDKRRAARLWRRLGIGAPESRRVRSLDDALALQRALGAPIVVKPTDGSGSESVFLCRNADTCRSAFAALERNGVHVARMIACEYVEGVEYSADFVVDGDACRIVRLARKVPRPAPHFGITHAYELLTTPPAPLTDKGLAAFVGRAARALGIRRAVCMVDFFLRDGKPVLIEMAPRPGGDCLPPLLREACGFDTLDLALRLARGQACNETLPRPTGRWVGVRLFADTSGTLRDIDASAVAANPAVRRVEMRRRPGDIIQLPPHDTNSWILGHAIARIDNNASVTELCETLTSALRIHIDPTPPSAEPAPIGAHTENAQ